MKHANTQGFPSIKIFGADKRKPTDYMGQRSASDIVKGGMAAARELVKSREAGGGGSKKTSSAGAKESSTG